MAETANDKTANAHASSPESIFLELVIQPTIGDLNQVDRMYFGYNELKRQGDWDEQIAYLQKEIGAKHPRLEATDAQATVALRNVLRDWHPGLAASRGRFTIQIRGALNLADAAQAATESAELQTSKQATLEAERQAATAREKERQAKDALERERKEREKEAKEEKWRTEKALQDAKDERDEVQRKLTETRGEMGRLKTELQARQHEQAAAQPQDAQLWAEFNELQMRFHDLEEQLTSANATIARLKGTATPSTPADNAPAWRVGQAATPPGRDARTDTAGNDTGPQYPDDEQGPLE